jgi:hypothetical protein
MERVAAAWRSAIGRRTRRRLPLHRRKNTGCRATPDPASPYGRVRRSADCADWDRASRWERVER